MQQQKILIIDFGSQVTQLIARRVRECKIYCEIHPFQNVTPAFIKNYAPAGIILSGSPMSVLEESAPIADPSIFTLSCPILGICYGQQTICHQLGGEVVASSDREFGRAKLHIEKSSPLYNGIWNSGDTPTVWMSHGDKVTKLPTGFDIVATSAGAPFAIIADEARKIYAVQFHPEVTHSENGAALIENFARHICAIHDEWNMATFKQVAIERIREQVGDRRVICGISGGVDSSVTAVLIHQAIGEQLTCIFVDHGLLRQGEKEAVKKLFRDNYNIPLVVNDSEKLFIDGLKNVSDPEKKRKIIGGLFIDVFEQEAKKLGGADFLAQGTLYPDVIESVSVVGDASLTIKSHHNVGGLPERMDMELVEPLRDLFKDEVRKLGLELGLPREMIARHPFPGPGLGIRILGDVTKEKCDILRLADAVYLDEIKKANLYDDIWQAFAVLLPVKTVGVMGDGRSYDYVCALRAVTSIDGMTADSYAFDHAFLSRVSTRIINEVKGINRVVYDYTSKPPGTIEWE